jgi:hypothetical protein
MITDVYIVYNDTSFIKKFGDTSLKVSPFFHFIDETTRQGKKEAFALKGHWGTRMTPFIICFDKETPVKAFYSETGENIIQSLIDYLNAD